MKRTLIRFLSLALTVSALLSALSTNAFAYNNPDLVCTDANRNCVSGDQAADVYTAAEWNRIGAIFGEATGYRAPFHMISYYTSLAKLAAYMPHIAPDAIPSKAVSGSCEYSDYHRFEAYSSEQDAMNTIAIVKQDPTSEAARNASRRRGYLSVDGSAYLYTGLGGSDYTSLATARNAANQAGTVRFIAGPCCGMWLSDTYRDTQNIYHMLMSERTFYYGENTLRGSAIQTVVFPWNLFSDHTAPDSNICALRVDAGLVLGKEAIVIAKDAFSDCANLTSVIFPTEPARLYFEDGVFANCPKLTVYAPAGGYIENYCKANGIRFQAVANGYLEPKVDAVPTEYCKNHSDKTAGVNMRCAISTYEPDFPNARVLVPVDTSSSSAFLQELAARELASVARDRDMNRYRSAEMAQFTKDNVLKTIQGSVKSFAQIGLQISELNAVSQRGQSPPRQPPGVSCSCTSCCPTGCQPHGGAGRRPA